MEPLWHRTGIQFHLSLTTSHSKNLSSQTLLFPFLCISTGSPDTLVQGAPCTLRSTRFSPLPLHLPLTPRGNFHMFKTLTKEEETLPIPLCTHTSFLLWDSPRFSWKIISSVNRVENQWAEQSSSISTLWRWSYGTLFSFVVLKQDCGGHGDRGVWFALLEWILVLLRLICMVGYEPHQTVTVNSKLQA